MASSENFFVVKNRLNTPDTVFWGWTVPLAHWAAVLCCRCYIGRVASDGQLSYTCIYDVQAWGFTAWVWPLWADSRCLHPTWLLYTPTKRICIHSISFPKVWTLCAPSNTHCCHMSADKMHFSDVCLDFFLFLFYFNWISNTNFSVIASENVKASSCGTSHKELQRPM